MAWHTWLGVAAVFGILTTAFIVAIISNSKENIEEEKRNKERKTYEGRITAIIGGRILLNSNHQTVETRHRNPQLIIGRHYEIVVDGNGYIVDATLKD
jgi:hypothetical protein